MHPPCPVETPVSRLPPLGFGAPHDGDVGAVRACGRFSGVFGRLSLCLCFAASAFVFVLS